MRIYGVTKRRHQLMQFIDRYVADHGYSPSFEEMKDGLGLHSKSGVHRLVNALSERGLIIYRQGRARSIVVVDRLVDEAYPVGL